MHSGVCINECVCVLKRWSGKKGRKKKGIERQRRRGKKRERLMECVRV